MKAELLLAGERLELRADRSLFWPARRTLVVADLHFGKADAFRAASVRLSHPTVQTKPHRSTGKSSIPRLKERQDG